MTSANPNSEQAFTINPERCAWRIVDGEAVLIHAETTFYYGLNPSGTEVWRQLLEGDFTAEEIAETIGAVADYERGRLAEEIASFLVALKDEGLLDMAEDSDDGIPAPVSLTEGWHTPEVTKYNSLEDLIVCGE